MATWRYEISLLVSKKYFSTLEDKFRISARPCNILYIFSLFQKASSWLFKIMFTIQGLKKTLYSSLSFLQAALTYCLLRSLLACL